jgi:hypothetical protein
MAGWPARAAAPPEAKPGGNRAAGSLVHAHGRMKIRTLTSAVRGGENPVEAF